jgi:hypothetical protein
VVDPLLRNILGRELKSFEASLKETLSLGDSGDAAVKQYSK